MSTVYHFCLRNLIFESLKDIYSKNTTKFVHVCKAFCRKGNESKSLIGCINQSERFKSTFRTQKALLKFLKETTV